ncbi:uncharacterized protein KQ657_001527 [Scheffersomyces spartinae]|uniref:Ribosome maturation protein SDO1/SBDS N-terminal domain-containing protein n=1 Tax=Scheffersomyces spartinae TaxID=45513 RepID=A0A9P7V7D8_9ASCO|nr:uncharacterized protein KQ657_001527 [Scheffersomyces spartinae]KAG7192744.1 hypothetical protein KQ657_001527 [Scheffersomyces spartinae]
MPDPHRIFLKGTDNDFIVFVDEPEMWEKYKKDPSIDLVDFVSVFQVFVTSKGSLGDLDTASEAELANEFGSADVNKAIAHILKNGEDRNTVDVRNKELK